MSELRQRAQDVLLDDVPEAAPSAVPPNPDEYDDLPPRWPLLLVLLLLLFLLGVLWAAGGFPARIYAPDAPPGKIITITQRRQDRLRQRRPPRRLGSCIVSAAWGTRGRKSGWRRGARRTRRRPSSPQTSNTGAPTAACPILMRDPTAQSIG